MSLWKADIANDPNHDYDLVIELLYDTEEIGVIKQGKDGLEVVVFATHKDLFIPFEWLLQILNGAREQLEKNNKNG